MAHRDIYVSRIRFRGDRLNTGRSLAAEIRATVDRRQLSGLVGHLRFVYVPSNAQPPFATAYVAFTRRDTHSAAVELLNGLIFRGQATLWRLGNNEPRRGDEIPPGAQFALDRPRPRPREPAQPRYFVMRRPGLVERLPTPPASPPPHDGPIDIPERPNSPPPGQNEPAPAPALPVEVIEELEHLNRRVGELELVCEIAARAREFGNRHAHFGAYLDGQLRATQAEELLRDELLHRDHDFYG